MLVWAIGLMGAGVFYVNNLLHGVNVPRSLRALALMPWLLGVLVAIAARAIGGRSMRKSKITYMQMVVNLKLDLLMASTESDRKRQVVETAKAYAASMGWTEGATKAAAKGGGSYTWWRRLTLATYVLLGVGVFTSVAVSLAQLGMREAQQCAIYARKSIRENAAGVTAFGRFLLLAIRQPEVES